MTHPAEARNGSSSARHQAASSNIPSPDFSDSFAIKRDGLTASVYRAPSGQWAWRLTDSLDEEIGGGSGYNDEGEAASDANAELDRRDRPLETRQPKGHDAARLARTITEIDAIVQSEAESLSATAKLARRAVIAAREQASGELWGLLGDLASVLNTLSYQAGSLADTVNGEVNAVACNHAQLFALFADCGEEQAS
ncbi:hypothetical protein THIX_30200 [Thiomonas sp. X19]|uniref:hypothetical protein n=1 Tax=Thiomonas sp. X19 TaxID=1050370 RepID=UPI000B641BE3|nr:hypothetical protein [Thiomonas sp. X19]SCC92972.1 hypothetical protein THIX_30200 [Thiomonas sp. X19]